MSIVADMAKSSEGNADQALFNVVRDGICADIQFVLKHGRTRAALILTFSGIDAMASLDRPEGAAFTSRDDFVHWVDSYLEFESGNVAGLEIYSARCAMLHTYGSTSRLSEQGKARQVSYTAGGGADILESPDVTNLVLISVEGLAFAFFRAIGNYIESLITDPNKRKLAAARLLLMVHEFDLDHNATAETNVAQAQPV